MKDIKEISNASDVTPKWFNKGVDAAILAPTAVNQQKIYLEYLGFRDFCKVPKVAGKPLFSMVGYSKMDLGIVKYHFEVGAGKENFEWIRVQQYLSETVQKDQKRKSDETCIIMIILFKLQSVQLFDDTLSPFNSCNNNPMVFLARP